MSWLQSTFSKRSTGLHNYIQKVILELKEVPEDDVLKITRTNQSIANRTYYVGNKKYKDLQAYVLKTADGKSKIYYTNQKPEGGMPGDLWFHTGEDFTLYRFDGIGWSKATLNGQNITAGTIDASKVNVSNINAGRIVTGDLDAGKVNIKNLRAETITSGYLNVDRIQTNSINGNKVRFGGVIGAMGYGNNSFLDVMKDSITSMQTFEETLSSGHSFRYVYIKKASELRSFFMLVNCTYISHDKIKNTAVVEMDNKGIVVSSSADRHIFSYRSENSGKGIPTLTYISGKVLANTEGRIGFHYTAGTMSVEGTVFAFAR